MRLVIPLKTVLNMNKRDNFIGKCSAKVLRVPHKSEKEVTLFQKSGFS